MASTVDRLIALAKGEVGYHEGRSNGHWDNREKYAGQVKGLEWANGQPWCAVFVCFLFVTLGLRSLLPAISASCDVLAAAFKKAGQWSDYPAVGAVVFYGSARDLTHTGLVIAYDADTITTIEGNTNSSGSREGDGVYVKTRRRRDPWVVGYGLPQYAEGIVSADPARQASQPSASHVAVKPPTLKRPAKVPSRFARFLHLAYRVSNSFRGLKWGHDHGYKGADLDQQVSAQGTLHCVHYDEVRRNGDFRWDTPHGKKVAPGVKISELSDAQIARLVSSDGYRIRKTVDMVRRAAVLGYTWLELERKGSVHGDPEVWRPVITVAHAVGITVVVKALSTIPGAPAALGAAKKAGADYTMALPRAPFTLRKAKWWPVTDFVRGKVIWI